MATEKENVGWMKMQPDEENEQIVNVEKLHKLSELSCNKGYNSSWFDFLRRCIVCLPQTHIPPYTNSKNSKSTRLFSLLSAVSPVILLAIKFDDPNDQAQIGILYVL